MKLNINKETTIESLQQAFTYTYPFLQIVFYVQDVPGTKHIHKKLLAGNVAHMLADRGDYHFIDINKNRSVAEVEADFVSVGLQAQVLRKSGSVFIETLLSRNWTLGHQNYEGEMLCYALLPVDAKKAS